MAYPDFHLGFYDAATNRGSSWRDLSGAEKAILAAELADTRYQGLNDADTVQALLHRERTGPATETILINATRRDVIGAAGGVTFLAALKSVAASSTELQAVYDYVNSEDTFVPSDPAFQAALGLLNSIVITGTKLLPDAAMAAVIALGHISRAIPDEQRPLADSRATAIGLDNLLLTAADIAATKGH